MEGGIFLKKCHFAASQGYSNFGIAIALGASSNIGTIKTEETAEDPGPVRSAIVARTQRHRQRKRRA